MLSVYDIKIGNILKYWEPTINEYSYFIVAIVNVGEVGEEIFIKGYWVRSDLNQNFYSWLLNSRNINYYQVSKLC